MIGFGGPYTLATWDTIAKCFGQNAVLPRQCHFSVNVIRCIVKAFLVTGVDNPNTDYDSQASCLDIKRNLVNVLRIISLFATVDLEAVDDQGNSYYGSFIEEACTRVRSLHGRSVTISFCCRKDYSFVLKPFSFFNLPDYIQKCCVALSLNPTHAPSHTLCKMYHWREA